MTIRIEPAMKVTLKPSKAARLREHAAKEGQAVSTVAVDLAIEAAERRAVKPRERRTERMSLYVHPDRRARLEKLAKKLGASVPDLFEAGVDLLDEDPS